MKKTLAATAIVAAVIALSTAPVAANAAIEPSPSDKTQAAAQSKEQNVDDNVERFASLDGGISTFGTIKYPEGGEWHYGTTGWPIEDNYSDYYHATRRHGSSTANGNGTVGRSAIVNAKTWSKSKVHHTFSGNTSFYRFG